MPEKACAILVKLPGEARGEAFTTAVAGYI